VTLAFFLRYPNPYASHVISCDVISREFSPSGSLFTTRVILKKATLPRWAPKGIISRSESWILEESEVDPQGKVVRCLTRNLEHVKALKVHETQTFSHVEEGYVDYFQSHLPSFNVLFQGKPCRPQKLGLFQGLVGASRNKSRTMALLVSERTYREYVFFTGPNTRLLGLFFPLQSREGVALILDLIRQSRRQPMPVGSSYLSPTSAGRSFDHHGFGPHKFPGPDDSSH
jgi:PRELI-like family